MVTLPADDEGASRKKKKGNIYPLFTGYSSRPIDYREYLRLRGKNSREDDNDDGLDAPVPINKGGGDDDFPSGAAETVVSKRKRRPAHSPT